ncbi:hypothetical protein J8J40_27800, partial [Mycobacterium tuberculosis]|nr:hypothetical protein [Mycobacterium tuberculosis]
MPTLVLPSANAAPAAAYAAALAERRRRTLVGVALFLACFALAFWAADIRLGVFFDKIGGFTSYIDRIL